MGFSEPWPRTCASYCVGLFHLKNENTNLNKKQLENFDKMNKTNLLLLCGCVSSTKRGANEKAEKRGGTSRNDECV
jgi:hypothetical protein